MSRSVNGERIFPLGMYMGENFPELAKLGLNIMQSYPAFAGPDSSNRTAKQFLKGLLEAKKSP